MAVGSFYGIKQRGRSVLSNVMTWCGLLSKVFDQLLLLMLQVVAIVRRGWWNRSRNLSTAETVLS